MQKRLLTKYSMIKSSKTLRMKGTYPNKIETTYNKPIANIMINGDKLKAFLLKSGTTRIFTFLFNTVKSYLEQ